MKYAAAGAWALKDTSKKSSSKRGGSKSEASAASSPNPAAEAKPGKPYGVKVIVALYLISLVISLTLTTITFNADVATAVKEATAQYGAAYALSAKSIVVDTLITGTVISALISIAIMYGIWIGNKWAWWVSFIFTSIGVIAAVYSIIVASLASSLGVITGLISLIIDLLVVYYLTRQEVKSYCHIGSSASVV